MNLNFFYDNLNFAQRQKVFAFKVPRFGEIWWCFPLGDSLEPNHALVLNVREQTWYDTPLPNSGRSAAASPSVFRYPIVTGVDPQPAQAYAVEIAPGGTGYSAGDVLTLVGGQNSIPVQLTADTVDMSGVITAVSISNAGRYVTLPSNPAEVTGGAGSGAKFNITWATPYRVWLHEKGLDEVTEDEVQPIMSYFETADFSLPAMKAQNRSLHVSMAEPDFVQAGDLQMRVKGRSNARASEVDGDWKTITETAATPEQQVVFFKTQRRELRFQVQSNVIGGDYQVGLILAHVKPGDGRALP